MKEWNSLLLNAKQLGFSDLQIAVTREEERKLLSRKLLEKRK